MAAGCFFHPLGRNQLFSVPLTLLQVQQPQLGKLADIQLQAAGAKGVAQGVLLAFRTGNSQGLKQPGHQIVHQRHPGFSLHQNAQKIGTCVVILENAARLMNHRSLQHKFYPVLLHHLGTHGSHQHGAFKAHGHGNQMAELHFFQILTGIFRCVLRKVIQNIIIHGEQPFLGSEGAGGGGEALGAGILVLTLLGLRLVVRDQLSSLKYTHSPHSQILRGNSCLKGRKIKLTHSNTPLFVKIAAPGIP